MINENFILDITRTNNGVMVWEKKNEKLIKTEHAVNPSFLLSFNDPHRWSSMLDGLSELYDVKSIKFRTIHGTEEGFRVFAGRDIVDKIEAQTGYQAKLYNVDIRPELLFAAENRIVPGGIRGEDRFCLEQYHNLTSMEITSPVNPHRTPVIDSFRLKTDDQEIFLSGNAGDIIFDLMDIIKTIDPDIILFEDYDTWSHLICSYADKYGIKNTLSRNGRFTTLNSRSYFSYGRMEHRLGAKIPQGRLIVDTRQSFMNREGNRSGIFLASRLTGLSPNLTSRLTPGTIVSGYEVYEALLRGIAVPYHKQDAEALRNLKDMRLDYRGGYMLQPIPGIYANVTQIDFTSFYPSIIVKYNLSPECYNNPETKGFLPEVLGPILKIRHETKRRKRESPDYAGMDMILKWMLVTCFGYTGYKNARFGRIEVHEDITKNATRILKDCIELVRQSGGIPLHAIIDCIFFSGGDVPEIEEAIQKFAGIPTESEYYFWVVLLPQSDGSGSYTSYYGLLTSGTMKMRGVCTRRHDICPYVRHMQEDLFNLMATKKDPRELYLIEDKAVEIYHRYRDEIVNAARSSFVITRRISRSRYKNDNIPQAVIEMYKANGITLLPGMNAQYFVSDDKKKIVSPSWENGEVDVAFYRRQVDKAWKEVKFAFHPKSSEITTLTDFTPVSSVQET